MATTVTRSEFKEWVKFWKGSEVTIGKSTTVWTLAGGPLSKRAGMSRHVLLKRINEDGELKFLRVLWTRLRIVTD